MALDAAFAMNAQRVLVLNAGSTSLKFGLFAVKDEVCEVMFSDQVAGNDLDRASATIAGWPAPNMVGHRVVHGGARVRNHCLIDDGVFADLKAAKALAPLHVPPALAGIEFSRQRFPRLPQIACLDTAFHADMPLLARTYPLPENIRANGVFRYGFHGLSCESIIQQLGSNLPERLVIAHLGGGCSVTAVRGGRSIDTTMGLTPSGGVMMASRSGDLDPGVLIYLLREKRLGPDALEDLIDRRGGLIGVSGSSGDLRELWGRPEGELAIAMFIRSAAKGVASMLTSLGGADLLVFTGGVGENDSASRHLIAKELAWAGVGTTMPVAVLSSLEDEEIARHSSRLVITTYRTSI